MDFYTRVLGMQLESFIGGAPPVERFAFKFGQQKINLHVQGSEFEPKAHLPVPGALDLCFIAAIPLEQVIERLARSRLAHRGRAGDAHRGDAEDPLGLCA